jgi:hypothetical protein
MSNYTFTPHELRIGSVVNYIEDGDLFLLNTLDWQDFKFLQDYPSVFNTKHQPIPITPELLVKMGLAIEGETWRSINDIQIECVTDKIHRVYIRGHLIKWVSYIHELQSIVYDLIGVWLELKENE